MEALLTNRKWCAKNKRWRALAFLPFLDCLAFFHIGWRARRPRWTGMGVIFAAVWLAILAWFCFTGGLGKIGMTFLFVLLSIAAYALGIVFAFLSTGDYLKLLASLEARQPQEPELLKQKGWRVKNSLWMLWSLVPGLGTVSFFHVGVRMKSRGMKLAGFAFLLLTTLPVGLWMLGTTLGGYIPSLSADALLLTRLLIFGVFTEVLLYFVQLYLCCVIRRDYLRAVAPVWEANRVRYACLNSTKWRVLQSWWMLLCLVPYCGGASLIYAGARTKKRKWIIAGAAITAALLAATIIGRAGQNAGDTALALAYALHRVFRVTAGFASLCFCTVIREEYITARAAAVDGYASEVDRALDAQARVQRRVSGVQAETPQPMAKPAARPAAQQPVKAPATAETIDLNTCSEETLRTLPGVGIAQAKQAMEYREAHGGFASVDEFVDVTGLKPHFAVQVFELAKASPVPAKAQEAKPARRRIDL